MAEFFNALSAVVVIFLILALGYWMGHLGWLTASEKKFISKYVVNIAVPINCVTGILKNFTRSELFHAGKQVLVSAVVVGLSLLISAAVASVLKLPRNRWGVFVAMAGISNTMFIGLPVTNQLFGPASLPYLMMYYMFSTIYTQTAAVMLCEHAGSKNSSTQLSIAGVLKDLLRKPPILGIITAFGLLLLNVQLPFVIMSAAGYIADTVTPLALIYSGFVLYEVGLKKLRFLPGLLAMLFIRLVIAPALCFGLCLLLGISGLARDVFVVMAGLPVVSQITVMAGAYGADEQYSAIGSSLSLIGMFVTLPVMMILL